MAAGLLDEAVDLLRPSPVPCPTSLVVKNGSKALSITSGDMPVPVSVHDDHDVLARLDLVIGRAVGLVEIGIGGLDRQLAAVRHRVAGIDRQVEQRVLELVRSATPGHSPPPARSRPDRLAERAAQQVGHAGDQPVERRRSSASALPPREGEQLLVSSRARAAALPSCRPTRSGCGLVSSEAMRRSMVRRLPRITVSRLLKSCAMPPVSWPIASIFCAWRSASSVCCRCFTSSATRFLELVVDGLQFRFRLTARGKLALGRLSRSCTLSMPRSPPARRCRRRSARPAR